MYYLYIQYILGGAATPRCERFRNNSATQLFRNSFATQLFRNSLAGIPQLIRHVALTELHAVNATWRSSLYMIKNVIYEQ